MKMFTVILVLILSAPVSAQTLAERTNQILEESAEYVDNVTTRVLCPECRAAGDKSRSYIKGSYYKEKTWTGGYYDENGFFVPIEFHGDSVTQYECSKGHFFEKER